MTLAELREIKKNIDRARRLLEDAEDLLKLQLKEALDD